METTHIYLAVNVEYMGPHKGWGAVAALLVNGNHRKTIGIPLSGTTSYEAVGLGLLTAPTNEFVGFYPNASTEALMEYRDSPSRSMFCAAFPSLSWRVPHSGQIQSRTDRFLTRTFL